MWKIGKSYFDEEKWGDDDKVYICYVFKFGRWSFYECVKDEIA